MFEVPGERSAATLHNLPSHLAEDLDHWLKHEPIQAKPSGFFTHSRKWVRRNPSTTVLVTLLIALAAALNVMVWNRKPDKTTSWGRQDVNCRATFRKSEP